VGGPVVVHKRAISAVGGPQPDETLSQQVSGRVVPAGKPHIRTSAAPKEALRRLACCRGHPCDTSPDGT
jgi:hypothetical protein